MRARARIFAAALVSFLCLAEPARAHAPVFSHAEYDCLERLGHELYEDLSPAVIDAMPLYVRENLRQFLNRQTCDGPPGVFQIVKPYLTEEDVKYLGTIGITAHRVDIMPRSLNIGLGYLIHDPALDAATKKNAILALVRKEMPPSFSALTESDLDFMDLNMSEGETLQRMPPNLIAELHGIINDPKPGADERHAKARELLYSDSLLTPEDIAYLHSIGHHEDFLQDPDPNVKGLHFAIADTTVTEEEKRRHIDALITPEAKRRSDWATTQQMESLELMLYWGFPVLAVVLIPLALRLAGRARFARFSRYLPWAVGAAVILWLATLLLHGL